MLLSVFEISDSSLRPLLKISFPGKTQDELQKGELQLSTAALEYTYEKKISLEVINS